MPQKPDLDSVVRLRAAVHRVDTDLLAIAGRFHGLSGEAEPLGGAAGNLMRILHQLVGVIEDITGKASIAVDELEADARQRGPMLTATEMPISKSEEDGLGEPWEPDTAALAALLQLVDESELNAEWEKEPARLAFLYLLQLHPPALEALRSLAERAEARIADDVYYASKRME